MEYNPFCKGAIPYFDLFGSAVAAAEEMPYSPVFTGTGDPDPVAIQGIQTEDVSIPMLWRGANMFKSSSPINAWPNNPLVGGYPDIPVSDGAENDSVTPLRPLYQSTVYSRVSMVVHTSCIPSYIRAFHFIVT